MSHDQTAVDLDLTEVPTAEQELAQARMQIPADAAVLVLFVVVYFLAQDLFETARWFPVALATFGFVVSTLKLFFDVRRWRRIKIWTQQAHEGEDLPQNLRGRRELSESIEGLSRSERTEMARWVIHVAVLLALIWLIGIVPATVVWLPATLILRSRQSPTMAAISTLVAVALLLLLHAQVGIGWPDSVFELVR